VLLLLLQLRLRLLWLLYVRSLQSRPCCCPRPS
jgi:hypothetical protein